MAESGDIRPDAELDDVDVPAEIAAGMDRAAEPRRVISSDAALAASLQAQALEIGPFPLRFLAQYVRSAGREAALALPEPLIGAAPTALARSWLTAAGTGGGPAADDRFAQWLDTVAALIALRLRSGRLS